MILSIHMITGAIIGSKVNKKPVLILIFAFLSHFVLDSIPHFEYILKPLTLFLDLSLGAIVAIILAYKNRLKAKIIIAAAFTAILPDSPAFTNIILRKINGTNFFNPFLNQLIILHNYFHTKLSFVVPAIAMRIILLVFILLAISYFIKMIVPKLKNSCLRRQEEIKITENK